MLRDEKTQLIQHAIEASVIYLSPLWSASVSADALCRNRVSALQKWDKILNETFWKEVFNP